MLTAGTTVSGYRIEGLVGEGGMATVYEARQISLNRPVALKLLARRLGDDPAFRERFRREWHIQARLDHPNIVPVYEAGDSDYGLWLAMRLVRGPTLRELLAEHKLTPAEVLRILGPIAQALDAAHESGLIHRDITPQNILVDERGQPFLSDFGITKGEGDRSLTRTGQFVGTLAYVAPEQIRDKPCTAATDTYSLAAILYEGLTGRVPFEKSSEAAVLFAHIGEMPLPPTSLRPELPKAIDPVLAEGLAKQPTERFASATELIAAAEKAFGEPPGERSPAAHAAPRTRRRFLRPPVALAAIGALSAAALAVGVLSSDGSPRSDTRAVAGDLTVTVPPGWEAARGGEGVPELTLRRPATLRPSEGNGEQSVVVGISAADGKTLLPPALERAAAGAARGRPVSLGSLQALRYLGLRPAGSSAPLAVFAAPVTAGVATVACSPYRRGAEFARECEQIAASLILREGRGYPLGPSPQLAVVLRRVLQRLNEDRTALRRRLAAAAGAARQASSASALAAAFRRAAQELSAQRVTPQSAAGLDALVAALRAGRDAYEELASAARSEDTAAYADAAAAVVGAEAAVDGRIRGLRSLGYAVEGG